MNNRIHLYAPTAIATSMLGTVGFSTSSDYMFIELFMSHTSIFSGRFYPEASGYIWLYDLGSVIEQFLENEGESHGEVHICASQPDADDPDECELCRELFASHDVRILLDAGDFDFDAMQPVLITESELEISDGDEKPNTAKFTYRLNSRRDLAPRLDSGTFNEPFNFPFS